MLLLLDRGANINVVTDGYSTALVTAIMRESADIVSLLLDRGADTNIVVGGEYGTALATAAYRNWKWGVLELLDRGAGVNVAGGNFGTALAAAVLKGDSGIVSLLLDRGADINAVVGEFGTALAAAAIFNRVPIVRLLLRRGADINLVGDKYGTALAAAAFQGHGKIVSLLLDLGADIDMLDGEFGTALAAAAYGGWIEVVLLLLNRGANINIIGGEYRTALATAVYRGQMDTISLLLDRGADMNILAGGEYGTALAAAAFKGRMEVVSLLLDRGADMNILAGCEYGTALAAAAFKGQMEVVSLLLNRGADLNLVTNESGTILGQAIYRGSTETAVLLLEHGADVMCVGGSYSTASGVYPSALDAAHSDGSRADPSLLARLQIAMREQNGSPVNNVVTRPPFPMPYTPPYSAICTNHHRGTPPSIIISSFDISTQSRTGGNITPEQADVPCRELNEEVLQHSLVALVGLHKGATEAKHQWIQNDIQYFVACNYDFGLAYAAARIAWKCFNEHSIDSHKISVQRGQWHRHARILGEARSKAIVIDSDHFSTGQVQQELITSPYSIMPRRLWDLRSNRVVDFQMLHAAQPTIETRPTFWAVSHSWTSDMSSVSTAINQHQWPVPLPKDISLEYLRSELLTLGAEYVWIDVLCLRQQSEPDDLEQLRKEEWKIDVPTIGNIYRAATNIVRYFNGLGVPFGSKDWDDPRHWLQRAWTLQEIAAENTTINGGISRDLGEVFLNVRGKLSGNIVKLRSALRPVIQLAAQVDSSHGCGVYELAREMTRRHATQPIDKLSGLFYLLHTTKLPCYDEQKTSEYIWRQCFHLLKAERKAEILFDFPYRGSDEQWLPTWTQVLDWPVRDPECNHTQSWISSDFIRCNPGEVSLLISNTWIISDAIFNDTNCPGEYKVKIGHWMFGFYLPYLSQEPIDIQDPVFTLAIADLGHARNWVVCKAIESVGKGIDHGVTEFKTLKKAGVIRTDSSSELLVGRLLQKMDCLFV